MVLLPTELAGGAYSAAGVRLRQRDVRAIRRSFRPRNILRDHNQSFADMKARELQGTVSV